jgi:hypothetical protein
LLAVVATVGCSAMHPQTSSAPAPATTTAAPTPPAPTTFVASTSDTRGVHIVDIRDGLSKAVAFKAISDFLTQKYSIDVSDPHAGFLMTSWMNATQNGAPDLRYRTRVVVRFLGEDGKQVSVRSEANWQRGDEWDVGYDTQLLEDVVIEVRARVGKKVSPGHRSLLL